VQDASTVVITPFDHSVIGDIERGISDSQMGLGISVDGSIIRITVPPLTQERREEFVKLVHKKAENGKIMIRQARAESNDEIGKMKKNNEITEDDEKRLEKEVQKLTDEYVEKIDEIEKMKEQELMTV
jgi:ribosome recycling factor